MIIKTNVKLLDNVDLVVAGGSATGVNAAVAAARMGLKVYIIEGQGCFGGTATSGLVTVWHSLYGMDGKTKIISGITSEILDALKKRNAAYTRHMDESVFENEDMKLVLDDLIVRSKVNYLLHTLVTDVVVKNEKITGVIIENKSGRQFIRAKMFIDATGDGDLAHFAKCPYEKDKIHQPPTMCVRIANWPKNVPIGKITEAVFKPKYRKLLPLGFQWGAYSRQRKDELMLAGTRVYNTDSTNGKSLSYAEVEGRCQVKVIIDILRKDVPGCKNISIAALPGHIGLRESRKIIGRYRVTGDELLNGRSFEDAIGYGSYRVDIHHGDGEGLTFYYLDGVRTKVFHSKPSVTDRWTERKDTANFYQIPFRCMLPQKINNLIVAGRAISADKKAYGALRVMVNCNQTGQAAGVAAGLCLKKNTIPSKLDYGLLRKTLKNQGAIIF